MNAAAGLILLDTSIVVHLARNKAAGRHIASDLSLSARPEAPLICQVTVGEALSLGRKLGWGGEKLSRLHALLRELVVVSLEQPGVIQQYVEVDDFCRRQGRSLSQNDLWIAAAACAANAMLVTTDKDFDPLHGHLLQRRFYNQQELTDE